MTVAYVKKVLPFFIILGVVIVAIAVTSPDAYTAGQRSSGIVMMLFASIVVWFIFEMIAIGKPKEKK